MRRVRGFGGGLLLLVLAVAFPSALQPDSGSGRSDPLASVIDRLLMLHRQARDPALLDLALCFAEASAARPPEQAGLPDRLRMACRAFAAGPTAGESPASWRRTGDRLLARLQRRLEGDRVPLRPFADPLRGQLRPGQMAVRFLFNGDRVLAFHIEPQETGWRELGMDAAALRRLVRRLADPLADFAQGRVDYLRIHFDIDAALRLYNVLLRPLLEPRPAVRELLLVADGELARLPFDALVTGLNGCAMDPEVVFSEYRSADYLLDRCAITQFLSLVDLQRRFRPAPYRLQLAAFGNPQTSGERRAGERRVAVADIPTSGAEVDSLGRLLPVAGARLFTGPAFTPDNFESWAPQARLVHIATHFFGDPRDPGRSALFFSPGADGVSMYEARRLASRRLPAELVVLSACESAECELRRGRAGGGMLDALRRAGARAVLASQWPVDEFNSQVIPLFYRRFLESGNAAAALRDAKRELLARDGRLNDRIAFSFAHPFLWAAFALVSFSGPD